jgi:hypothetical protein
MAARVRSCFRRIRWTSLIPVLTAIGFGVACEPVSAAAPTNAEVGATLGFPRPDGRFAYSRAFGGEASLFFPVWRRVNAGGYIGYLKYSDDSSAGVDVSVLSMGPRLRVLLTGGPASRLSTYCSFSYLLHTRTTEFSRRCCVLRSPEDDTIFGPSADLSASCRIGATPVSILSTLRYWNALEDYRNLKVLAVSLGAACAFKSVGR